MLPPETFDTLEKAKIEGRSNFKTHELPTKSYITKPFCKKVAKNSEILAWVVKCTSYKFFPIIIRIFVLHCFIILHCITLYYYIQVHSQSDTYTNKYSD